MEDSKERDEWLRTRLQEAVDELAQGSADKFGRILGFMNGGLIRQILNRKREVRGTLLKRAKNVAAHPELHAEDAPRLRAWFDGGPAAGPITASTVAETGEALLLTPQERDLILNFRAQVAQRLRAGEQRAGHDRRVAALPFDVEKRSGQDRRGPHPAQHLRDELRRLQGRAPARHKKGGSK